MRVGLKHQLPATKLQDDIDAWGFASTAYYSPIVKETSRPDAKDVSPDHFVTKLYALCSTEMNDEFVSAKRTTLGDEPAFRLLTIKPNMPPMMEQDYLQDRPQPGQKTDQDECQVVCEGGMLRKTRYQLWTRNLIVMIYASSFASCC